MFGLSNLFRRWKKIYSTIFQFQIYSVIYMKGFFSLKFKTTSLGNPSLYSGFTFMVGALLGRTSIKTQVYVSSTTWRCPRKKRMNWIIDPSKRVNGAHVLRSSNGGKSSRVGNTPHGSVVGFCPLEPLWKMEDFRCSTSERWRFFFFIGTISKLNTLQDPIPNSWN